MKNHLQRKNGQENLEREVHAQAATILYNILWFQTDADKD
jgi:hypothetical protein